MKISIAQLNYRIGNFTENIRRMKEAIQVAKDAKSDIICFGELATTGYPPRDFLEFNDFIARANQAIEELKEESHDIAIVVGSPMINPVPEGKDLFNSAYFLYEGEIKHIHHKTLLPTYDIFDEYRYFESVRQYDVIDFKGKKIALTVCEDIWNIGNENPLYDICPMDDLIKMNPDFMINVSASPFSYSHAQERIDILKENTNRYKLPIFYINHVGAQTEVLFDGGSVVMAPDGKVHREMPYFEEKVEHFELEEVENTKAEDVQEKHKMTLIHDALVMGVRDYFEKLGFKKAIIGLSGGIDSAVTAVLSTRALGKENVRVVLMPSPFSSGHSVEDAKELAINLGIQYDIVPIKDPYETFLNLLDPLFEGKPFNVTEENIQARCRGLILMALSNKHGNILLNTSNKSEMAVGYGTLYGDLAGGISVIGDVYKTEVFELARYMNKDGEVIPLNTITKPPSAELRPDQKDSDSLPDYDILDEILFQYIEKRKGPKEIIAMGHDKDLVKRVLRLVNNSEFKRHQTAPVLRISSKAFGMGRRLPIVAKYLS